MKRTGNEPTTQKEAAELFSLCAVTKEARRAVETRLYDFPRLHDALEGAEGLEALLLSLEIRRVEKALESVCRDEYFPVIPIRYFQNADERQAADALHCDKATVWRNRERLLATLALRLMGTAAWKANVTPQLLSNATERMPGDAYKTTERRLYAMPNIRAKLADDREAWEEVKKYGEEMTLEEALAAVTLDLETAITADENEIHKMECALAAIADDKYYEIVPERYFNRLSDEKIAERISRSPNAVWQNRRRLIQRLAVRLYGAEAVR